ncbi:MAG: HAD-IA family hydrolase [Chitinophagaceae bacterium]
MLKVKNILFDLGNVIIPICPEKTFDAFVELGFKGEYEDVYKLPIFKQYEKGEVSTDLFLKNLQEVLSQHQKVQHIADAWNSMIMEFDKINFLFLNSFKKKFKLLLVSNTNDLHTACFEPKVLQTTQYDIEYFFHNIYYSQVVGMRKPDQNIFYHIIEKENISTQETLFIDDSWENICTAKKLGFQTIYFTEDTTELNNVINKYLKE